jgi:hypothetical protein
MYQLCFYFGKKNELGYILGHFFTNSSGHPARATRVNGIFSCKKMFVTAITVTSALFLENLPKNLSSYSMHSEASL